MPYQLTKAVFCIAILITGCTSAGKNSTEEVVAPAIIPVPKEYKPASGRLQLPETVLFYADQEELGKLYEVLQDELKSLYHVNLLQTDQRSEAHVSVALNPSFQQDEYQVLVNRQIQVTGGSYRAVAMGTVSVLQAIQEQDGRLSLQQGAIHDQPDLEFRGILIDVARKEHEVEVLKQLVSLCRWYKVNYLQLHLTDEKYFTFPSEAYPQLMGQGFHFTREELTDLVAFADARGVELIPELEVPGHAGQFVEQMPELFGFKNKALNRYTINMAKDEIYPVLDKVIEEIAAVFHSSEYIHIGGDEANFSGMDQDPEMKQYLQNKGLASVEELYWHFLNRMNESVKKQGKKTIVWEGFSKEANPVISKDIIVMAWETMYQLPQDLLDAGFNIINVSWKPLYVVNDKKWSTRDIYNWNVYQWQNWVKQIPSYNTIQLEEHSNVIGAGMASWDQPAYVEVSSLRLRLPALAERVWNRQRNIPFSAFNLKLQQLDNKLDRYFSPVAIQEEGLRYPEVRDGRKQEQTWFGDTLLVRLSAPAGYTVRYTTDRAKVKLSSAVYKEPLKLDKTTTLKYRAYNNKAPVGHEILKYYELNPLDVTLTGKTTMGLDTLWEKGPAWFIPMADSMQVRITPLRAGEVRYEMGSAPLTSKSALYQAPFTVKGNTLVKAGLFVEGTLTGKPWVQHFRNTPAN